MIDRNLEVVGASGFEPPTSWSRTKRNSIDSVLLNTVFDGFSEAKLDPIMDPKSAREDVVRCFQVLEF